MLHYFVIIILFFQSLTQVPEKCIRREQGWQNTPKHFWGLLLHKLMLFHSCIKFKVISKCDRPLWGSNFAPRRSLTQICWTKRRNWIRISEKEEKNEDVMKCGRAYMSWCLWIMWLLYSKTGGMASSSSGTWNGHMLSDNFLSI